MQFNEGLQKINEVNNTSELSFQFNPDKRIDTTEVSIEKSSVNEGFNPDKRISEIKPHEDGLYTTFEDRVKCTNLDKSEGGLRGEWTGTRGDSMFIPSYEFMKNHLEKYGVEGVKFENGVADFTPFAEASVKIDRMTSLRPENFRQADEKLAEKFNNEKKDGRTDWTAETVAEYIQEHKLTRHECSDMLTVELVPRIIHDYFKHSGGVAECKVRDNVGRGGFDE